MAQHPTASLSTYLRPLSVNMCVRRNVVPAACGHNLAPRIECHSALPPDDACAVPEFHLVFYPGVCDDCLDEKAATSAFGAAYASCHSKKSLDKYWTDRAHAESCHAVQPGESYLGIPSWLRISPDGLLHWMEVIKLVISECRPDQVSLGSQQWRHFPWAGGSSETDCLEDIAGEVILQTLKSTANCDEGCFDEAMEMWDMSMGIILEPPTQRATDTSEDMSKALFEQLTLDLVTGEEYELHDLSSFGW